MQSRVINATNMMWSPVGIAAMIAIAGVVGCATGNPGTGDGECGNLQLDDGEECDDGNTFNEDGCSATCQVEECGDGVVQSSLDEECDDGNTVDGDGCSAACVDENINCGDGHIDVGEECDDGNRDNGDGCSSACLLESAPVCGNGTVEGNEQCDDGNTTAGDGCSDTCMHETPASCGDGTVDTGEECDDGNTSGGDGCSATCTWEQLCTPDETITCNSSDSMGSLSGNDSDNYSCASTGGSSDRIYALTIPAGTTSVTANFTCDDWDDDYDLFILEGACNGGLCIDYGNGGTCDSVTFNVTAGLTYYIVVEEFSGWMGGDLDINCN